MEGFDSMIKVALQNNWIRGSQIGGDREKTKEICHMLYAGDTTLFCKPIEESIKYNRLILLLFEATSGFKINWGKSNLFPMKEMLNLHS